MRNRINGITVLIALVGFFYLYEDYQRSFSTPLEAIYHRIENEEWLTIKEVFASSKLNNHADYFYITNSDNIVAVELSKGMFGWRFNSYITGSGLNINHNISNSTDGYTRSGDLVFGLASDQVDRIEVNNFQARLIPLDLYIENKEIKGKQFWYIHIKNNSGDNNIDISVYDKTNKEL